MFRSVFDPIGFNPTQNQAEFGVPQKSPWSLALRRTPPMAQVDYYPSWPYKGRIDYTGRQRVTGLSDPSLYGQSHGYRGIIPVTALPLINKPRPYQVRAVSPFNIGG